MTKVILTEKEKAGIKKGIKFFARRAVMRTVDGKMHTRRNGKNITVYFFDGKELLKKDIDSICKDMEKTILKSL